MIQRIGVLTGGGDCPGLNAVIRAVTRAAILKYGWEVVGFQHAFLELMTSNTPPQPLTLEAIRGILPQGGTILGTTNRADPFRFPVTLPDGTVTRQDQSALLLERLAQHAVDALVMIGGDGTMALAQKLRERGLQIVGVPKTIDNDLSATDYTFGFDSACNIAMEAIDRLHTTAASHDRVMICEVMGRDAGWIALHAGMAGGADVILLPEIPYEVERVAATIRERHARGREFSIVVVAEGAMPAGGDSSFLEDNKSMNRRLMGAGHRLAEALDAKVPQEVRVAVLGHLQRGGSPTHFDRVLGTRFGEEAVALVAASRFGEMVALRGQEIVSCDLLEAIGQPKRVDPAGQLVQSARALGISFGDQ
jgi:phosphofructokinase-like protein